MLIHISPMYMRTMFLDSGSAIKKNYTYVKIVLDDALTKYVHQEGSFKSKRPTKHDMYTFLHITSSPCIKQPEGSHKEAYYALYHMLAYVRDKKNLMLPESLQPRAQKLAMIDDDNLRQHYRIQEQFAIIIFQDVIRTGGMFYTVELKPSNDEVDKRLLLQGDDRAFLLAGGGFRFVPDVGKLKC
jgi:hypothetical protein